MGWYDYPEPKFEKAPQCPVCGEECEKFYMHRNEVIGCDQCITLVYADEEYLDETD